MPTLDTAQLREVKDYIKVSERYSKEKFFGDRRPQIMRRWFSGDHYGSGMPLNWVSKRDRVVDNITQANLISKVSRLSDKPPVINVRALDRDSRSKAQGEKRLLTFKFNQIGGPAIMQECLFDCKIVGMGAAATGWSAVLDEESKPDPDAVPTFSSSRPVVRCVSPDLLILDPDSPDDIQEGWWCGERMVVPLSRARRLKKYDHVKDKLLGASQANTEWGDGSTQPTEGEEDEHLRSLTIDVIYLMGSHLRIEYCEKLADEPLHVGDRPGIDFPTDDQDKPYFPYVLMNNVPDYNGKNGKSTHFGIGDPEITETEQMEIEVARSIMAQHRRMSPAQWVAAEGRLDDKAKGVLYGGKYNSVVEIDVAANENLNDALTPLQKPPIVPEVYTTKEDARRSMGELTRTASFERSGVSPNVEFATEAAMMQAGAEAGKAWERQKYERFTAKVITQVSYQMHQWSDGTDLVDIEGEKEPREMRGTEFGGKYEHTIEPKSMEPPDKDENEQKWFNRLQGVAGFAEGGADPKPLLKEWLESFDAPDIDTIMAGFDNLAQLKQAMQQQGMQAKEMEQVIEQAKQIIEEHKAALQKATAETEAAEDAVEKVQAQLAIEKTTSALELQAARSAARGQSGD